MFFKNITAFRLTEKFELTAEELVRELTQFKAVEPTGLMAQAKGFAPVIDDEFVLESNDCMMICFQQLDKVLPSSVVNDELDKRVAEIKESEGRAVGRKAKQEIKDQIVFELLPRAFIRQSKTFAYIDVKNDWLIVDTSSQSKAEDVLSLLRKALEGLPALPINTKIEFTTVMKAWVTIPNCHTDFVVGEECRIVDSEEKSSIINVKNFDVTSDTITENIAHGMQVRSLALTYKDRVSFVLNSDFIIKRVKFLDLAMESRSEFDAGDERQKMFVDMILMTGEISSLLGNLINTFGGYREQS